MQGFYGKEGSIRELLAKEKTGLFLGQDTFFEEKGMARFLLCRLPLLSLRDVEGPCDRLLHWC